MNWAQFWLGLGIAAPASTLGYLAFRRSRRVDANTDAVLSIEELNNLVDQLTEERDELKAEVNRLRKRR